ncbi:MAG: hypothetical protein KatS3mg020_0633 [Fimbriimonadales bacterium]|nr:MAG: hypothetical protein KatS3mg019_1787 [Fimbriimonadales bacterium]GIV11142.1 MAG: hypothetical protein KatS3mg020_0633 [Fimbriimonadales bacterium]
MNSHRVVRLIREPISFIVRNLEFDLIFERQLPQNRSHPALHILPAPKLQPRSVARLCANLRRTHRSVCPLITEPPFAKLLVFVPRPNCSTLFGVCQGGREGFSGKFPLHGADTQVCPYRWRRESRLLPPHRSQADCLGSASASILRRPRLKIGGQGRRAQPTLAPARQVLPSCWVGGPRGVLGCLLWEAARTLAVFTTLELDGCTLGTITYVGEPIINTWRELC